MGAAGALCIRHDASAPRAFTRGRPYEPLSDVEAPRPELQAGPELLVGAGSSA